MADRKNPFLEAGFGEYKGIHRMPFALQDRAAQHEANRQRVVASILLEIQIMAIVGIIRRNQPLTLRGAATQNLSGNKEDATEAAHCVPRQLLIDGLPVYELMQASYPDRAWALSLLFAETDILPANFNKCDSRAERLGLNEAFRKACQHSIDSGHYYGTLDPTEINVLARKAYGVYRNIASVALLSSVDRLKAKLKPKFIFPQEKAKWTEQLRITEEYAETLKESPGKDMAITPGKISGLIRIYTMPPLDAMG